MYYNSVAVLSSGKFIVAYRDSTDVSKGTAKVGTVSGTNITFGAEAEFGNSSSFIAAAPLDADRFVVAWQDGADSNHGTAKVGTVSGTTIAFGTEAEFLSANGAYYISAAALSSGKFVVAYRDSSDSFHGTAKVGTVSGTDITFGAETEFFAGTVGGTAAAALSAGKFVVAYPSAPGDHGQTRVGTVSSTAIAFGTEEEFLANAVGYVAAAALGAGKFVVAYDDGSDSSHGKARVWEGPA